VAAVVTSLGEGVGVLPSDLSLAGLCELVRPLWSNSLEGILGMNTLASSGPKRKLSCIASDRKKQHLKEI